MSPETRSIIFSVQDEPLRHEVGELATLLGQVLVEQAGQELFDHVETARHLARERRDGVAACEPALDKHVTGLDLDLFQE